MQNIYESFGNKPKGNVNSKGILPPAKDSNSSRESNRRSDIAQGKVTKSKCSTLHIFSKLRWGLIKAANPDLDGAGIRQQLAEEYRALDAEQRDDLIKKTKEYNETGTLTQ